MSTSTEENALSGGADSIRDEAPPAEPAATSRWAAVQPWLSLIVRVALAGILGYAGYTEVIVPALSVESVTAYELFGETLTSSSATPCPCSNSPWPCSCSPGWRPGHRIISALLMAVFIAGIASAWARGLTIDCGCFGRRRRGRRRRDHLRAGHRA